MTTPIEIQVKVSNDEQKYVQKFLEYTSLTLDHDDPKLKAFVNQTIANFNGAVDEVVVKFSMQW